MFPLRIVFLFANTVLINKTLQRWNSNQGSAKHLQTLGPLETAYHLMRKRPNLEPLFIIYVVTVQIIHIRPNQEKLQRKGF